MADEAARGDMPKVYTLQRMSRLIYRAAQVGDEVSIVLDGEVPVQVQA